MFETADRPVVEDTEENRAICSRYCRSCQNYAKHHLEKYQPDGFFCARGQSSETGMRMIGCSCSGCGISAKYHLRGGYFCVRR